MKSRTNEKWEREKQLAARSLFPPRLASDVLELPDTADLSKLVGKSLFLSGPTGSGKTVLAAKIAIEQVRLWYMGRTPGTPHQTIRFVSVPELFRELKQSFQGASQKTEHEILQELYDLDFLVLDELGVSSVTDWGLTNLYLLINHRYEHFKPTIYTSNLDLPALEKLYGDSRIPSRIERSAVVLEKERTW